MKEVNFDVIRIATPTKTMLGPQGRSKNNDVKNPKIKISKAMLIAKITMCSGDFAWVELAAGKINKAGSINPPTILMATAVVIAMRVNRITFACCTLMPLVRAKSSLILIIKRDRQKKIQTNNVRIEQPAINRISHDVVAKSSPNRIVSGLI